MNRTMNYLWKLSPQTVYHSLKDIIRGDEMEKTIKKLSLIPPKTGTEIDFMGKRIIIPDAPSFLSMYTEIFKREVMDFSAGTNPLIFDCGANIGISIIYFKLKYPASTIIAFEADPEIFKILKHNIAAFGFDGVQLFCKACSDHKGITYFKQDGADGGRIIDDGGNRRDTIHVEAVRLKDFIRQKIDFMKLDIEGSETDVLLDCGDVICNIDKMYIEYHSFKEKGQTLHLILALLDEHNFKYTLEARKYVKVLSNGEEKGNMIDMHVYIDAVRRED